MKSIEDLMNSRKRKVVTLSVKVEADMAEEFRTLTKRYNISQSEIVRNAMRDAISKLKEFNAKNINEGV